MLHDVNPSVARLIWRELEAVNSVTYFSPESRRASKDLALRGFWMGYFANRAAPLGAVAAGPVEATFFNFHPAMVRRALPEAWTLATPERILAARSRSAAAAIRRHVPTADDVCTQLLPLLLRAIDGAVGAGRPLFAANRDLSCAGEVIESVWQACTTLREHRGDGHVALLVEAELDGCEAHVLYAATEPVAPEALRDNRGWSTREWEDAVARLRHRGLLTTAGEPTESGRELREHIEGRTDKLAAAPYAALARGELDDLLRLARLVARPIVLSGEIPFPNPMGLPGPPSATC